MTKEELLQLLEKVREKNIDAYRHLIGIIKILAK